MVSNTLTNKETAILRELSNGLTVIEIGERMLYSTRMIQFYLKPARDKLNAKNNTHAVAIAIRNNWV